MAARTITIKHDEKTRSKIRTSQLINRLNDHVFKAAVVSQTQMKAIEILLRKTLPDLSTVTLEGGDNAIRIEQVQRTIVRPPNSDR